MKSICPTCQREYDTPPAISRTDNRTKICPTCGVKEALSEAGIDSETQEKILSMIDSSFSEDSTQ